MELTERQEKIVEIVKNSSPITGEQIASKLNLTRATLRPDLTILTMAGILEAKPRVGYFYKGRNEPSPYLERILQLRVGDFKSIPAAIAETTTIYDAIVTLFTQNVGSLIVVDESHMLLGMVSRKDLLKATLGKTDLQVPISVIMTRMPNIIVTTPDETVINAARKLSEHEVDTLPVVEWFVDENGEEKFEVVGRFTKTNVTDIFVQLGTLGETN